MIDLRENADTHLLYVMFVVVFLKFSKLLKIL